jgi:hypothetical protein
MHGLFQVSPVKTPAEDRTLKSASVPRESPPSSPVAPEADAAPVAVQVQESPAHHTSSPHEQTAASAARPGATQQAEATRPPGARLASGEPRRSAWPTTEPPGDKSSSAVPPKPSPPVAPSFAPPPKPALVSSPPATARPARSSRGGFDLREFLWPDVSWIRAAIVVVALSPLLAWGGWKLMLQAPDRPMVQYQSNTFDAETPTPVVLMVMLIKSGEAIAYQGRRWELTPLKNVVLQELGDKDADGYQTAVVSFDRVEEGRAQFHATVRLTFKLTELKMQGDLVVRADYDVKSVEILSTEAAK